MFLRCMVLCAAIGLAGIRQASAEPLAIDGGELARLMAPMLDVAEDQHAKVDARALAQRRFAMPSPALLVFFGADGCITAVVGPAQRDAVDDRCLSGAALPTRDMLVAAAGGDAGAHGDAAVMLFSPLLAMDALLQQFPDAADGVRADLQALDELREQLREDIQARQIVDVAVHL